MFRSLRLVEAFEHLVSPEDWSWFGPMVSRGATHVAVDGWPLFSTDELRAYDLLWKSAAERALQKLKSGEWVAEGISVRYGATPEPIATDLWDYLRIEHRTETADGSGFRFLALRVSDVRPPRAPVSYVAHANLSRQLTEWIKQDAQSSPAPRLRAEQLAAARHAFAGQAITENMFRNCRRAAGLPEKTVQRGRPKTKGSGR